MKKTIPLFVMIIGCTMLANFSSFAQNVSAETKPMKSTLKPESAVSSAPASTTLQKSNEQQNAKPIVPGGEFKPRDTRAEKPSAKLKEYDEPKLIVPNTSSNAPISAPAKKGPVKPAAVTEQQKQN